MLSCLIDLTFDEAEGGGGEISHNDRPWRAGARARHDSQETQQPRLAFARSHCHLGQVHGRTIRSEHAHSRHPNTDPATRRLPRRAPAPARLRVAVLSRRSHAVRLTGRSGSAGATSAARMGSLCLGRGEGGRRCLVGLALGAQELTVRDLGGGSHALAVRPFGGGGAMTMHAVEIRC